MPLSARRTGAMGALAGLFVLLTAFTALIAPAAGARSIGQAVPVGGVDIDAVVTELADDHVAIVGTVGQPEADWAAVVSTARDAHLNLSVVVLGTAPVGATPTDVATAVLGQVKGTILVQSPATSDGHTVGLASNDVGQAEVDSVVAELDGSAPTPETAQAVVDRLTDDGFPWLLVVVGGLIVVLCLGVAYGLWRGRQHRRDRVEAPAELIAWLRTRLAEMVGRLAGLAGPVAGTGRDDLRTRLLDAQRESEAIAAVLQDEPVDRARIDAVAGRLATLDGELAALRTDVDAARAG